MGGPTAGVGVGAGGGFWWSPRPSDDNRRRRRRQQPEPHSSSSDSVESAARGGGRRFAFPLHQAGITGCLTLTGDTIAQVRQRISDRRSRTVDSVAAADEDLSSLFLSHDWLRALRMASYGFLIYGPGSYIWYQFLDRCMPAQNLINLSSKVVLNQIVLGPCIIAAVFAWNNLWLGKLSDLPSKYRHDALPTLLFGFKFWIPVSVINFGIIPLPARVAFMSSCSIFWNFYLSTTLSK